MDCLGLPLILREIMKYFSTTELIELSLVNKFWNYEARSLMKIRGNLIARLDEKKTCEVLEDFASDLHQMKQMNKIVPFSGMSMSMGGFDWDHGVWCADSAVIRFSDCLEVDKVYEYILDHITWKHLSVNLNWLWMQRMHCPAFQLLRKIMQNCCKDLEEFSIVLPENLDEFTEKFLHGCSFPRLKVLKILDSQACSEDYTRLIKLLVSYASNLQVLYTEGNVDTRRNLLEGSSAVHVTNYPYLPSLDKNDVPELVVGKTRMQRMCLRYAYLHCHPEVLHRLSSTLFFSLKSSRTTLSSIDIGAIFLVPLNSFGFTMENVRSLHLHFTTSDFEISQQPLCRLVKYFNFTRIFPKLRTVCVSQDLTVYRGSLEIIANSFLNKTDQLNVANIEPTQNWAVNIKNVRLNCYPSNMDSSIRFFAEMFPDISTLSISAEEIFPLHYIWDSRLNLEELDVTFNHVTYEDLQNLDRSCCGIFPEKMVELLKLHEDHLQKVNVVPVMPSIVSLKELKAFNVCLNHLTEVPPHDPVPTFSAVTRLVAFKRCPGLTVTLVTKHKAWDKDYD